MRYIVERERERERRFIVYSEQIRETLSMMRNWLLYDYYIDHIFVFMERMIMQIGRFGSMNISNDDSFRYNYYSTVWNF